MAYKLCCKSKKNKNDFDQVNIQGWNFLFKDDILTNIPSDM